MHWCSSSRAPTPSRTCARPKSSFTRACRRRASIASRASSSTSAPSTASPPPSWSPAFITRPSCGPRASGRSSMSRHCGPPPAWASRPTRPTRTPTTGCTGIATSSSSVPGRPASPPRCRRDARACAPSSWRKAPNAAAACCRGRGRSMAWKARPGCPAYRKNWRNCRTSSCSIAPRSSGTTTTTT